MADYQEKANVAIAASSISKHPMHAGHLTTSNFMQFDVAFAKEFPAKSNIKFNHQTFVRAMPMKKPIMGSIQFHKSSYFVPFRVVWEPFTDFLEDVPHVQSEGSAILSNVPLLSNNAVVNFLIKYGADLIQTYTDTYIAANPNFDWENINRHDFSVRNAANDSYLVYDFNSFGRHCYKLLTQLGYAPSFGSTYDISGNSDITDSALPLLCAAKVYLDFYFPVQYAMTGYYINLEGIFDRQFIYTLNEQDLLSIFSVCYLVSYSSDYFTSAFDQPVAGNIGTTSLNFNIVDLSAFSRQANGSMQNLNSNGDVNQLANGTPVIGNTSRWSLTQYSDDALKALTNYIRRHQLSSSRSLERYLADWGVALTADKLQRCYKLREQHYPLQVADVMSQSDTITDENNILRGAQLGDYAGKGVAFNQDFNFECDSDEFGMLLIISSVVPDIAYYQGKDRNVMHKTKLDFLNGNFDGKFINAISRFELFSPMHRQLDSNTDIFGFGPYGMEYATARDQMTGDFRLHSLNVGLLPWSTCREFSDNANDPLFDIIHNFNFVLANDFDQFNRIFMDSEDDSDKFILVHRANFEANMPKKPLYDYYDWDEGHKEIKMQVNGSKSN